MRLKSVIAPDSRQALARLRACLGDDAVIVATTELKDGGVRITGAIDHEQPDLAELLAPTGESPCTEFLAAMARHHELPDHLCERLIGALRDLPDAEPTAALGQALPQICRFESLPRTGRLLLLGPSGAGKTASVAKLAARAVLAGQGITVVSTDTDRAGGIAQLTSLLEPLHVQPEAAPDMPGLQTALATSEADSERQLILIDTAGINPFRPADLGVCSNLIAASGADPVLVLAAGTSVADSAEIGQTFAALGARWLLPTKLDATRRLGGVLTAADAGLALADAGIGPTIGRGLGPLSATGLARLLMRALDPPGTDPAAKVEVGRSNAARTGTNR